MQSAPAEGAMADTPQRRGRPRGSRVDPVVRFFRQTENPNHMTALIARAIIDWHQPREEREKRLRAELNACRARGGDVWPILDALQMLDTHDSIGREEKRITHKQALKIALKQSAAGVHKSQITIETDTAGHRLVSSKPLPKGSVRRPDPGKALDMLRRGRAK
jgi:hypothetical protein